MLNWLWKWLGYHVCEEFTQWEAKREFFTLIPIRGGYPIESMSSHCSEMWQTRRCKVCGKTYRERLPGA